MFDDRYLLMKQSTRPVRLKLKLVTVKTLKPAELVAIAGAAGAGTSVAETFPTLRCND